VEPEEQQPPQTPEASGATVVVEKRTVYRRTRQVLAWLLLVLLFLVFGTAIFVQLPVFKRIIVNELVKTIESSTNGTLVVKEIKGNLLQGFVMNDVTLLLKTNTKYDTVPVIHADHILAKYSIVRWLRKSEVGITSMVLQHPVVRVVKFAGDTVWNMDLLTKSVATAPQSPPTPFTQIVDLASFRIEDGSMIVRDYNFPARVPKVVAASSTSEAPRVKEDEIDWANLDLEGIDLDSRFYANGSTAQSAKVNHLRFTEKQSGFFVQHLEFAGYFDSIQARMDDAKIITGHTNIDFSVELSPPKIIQTGLLTSIEHSTVKAKIYGPVISTYELKQFLPGPLGFLAGSPGIALDVSGEFGKLNIRQLALDFKGRGNINISGDLRNLHHTDSLAMDVSLSGRGLSNATLQGYVPGLHLPDISRFGTINIGSLTYGGAPLNFHTKFDAKSSGAGNVAGDVELDLRGYGFKYRADLKTQAFNIAAVANDPKFESSISADVKLQGMGTEWRTLTSDVTMKLAAPSTFEKYRVNALDLAGKMNRGTLTVDHLNAAVEGGPEVQVRSGMIDLVAASLPFRFDGTVKDLRLADVLGKASRNPARIDLDADVIGTARNFEDLTGTAHARLFNLVYKGHKFDDVLADLKLAPSRAGENSLSVKSALADITIDHRFRLGDLIYTVPDHVNALLTAIQKRDFPDSGVHTSPVTNCADSVDFDYYAKLKDLRPLADFFPRSFLLGEGVISGSVYGCPQGDISLIMNGDSLGFILRNRTNFDSTLVEDDQPVSTADTLLANAIGSDTSHTPRVHLDSLGRRSDSTLIAALAPPQFGAGSPRIHVTPTNFRFVAHNISNDPHKVIDHLDATFTLNSDSIVRLGSAMLYRPKIDLAYKNQVLDFDIGTVYNDVAGIRLIGDAHFPRSEFDLAIDSLKTFFLRSSSDKPTDYVWMNEGTSHIRISDNGHIAIDTLTLVHPLYHTDRTNALAQRLSLGGELQGDSINVWAKIPTLDLSRIRDILPMQPGAKTYGLSNFEGRLRDVRGTLTGTLQRPDIAVHLFADTMRYGQDGGQITFDSNAADLTYSNQALRGNVVVHVSNIETESETPVISTGPLGAMHLQIDSIPMTIALKRGPTYAADSAAAIARPLSASLNTTRFPLDVATPFIPVFSSIQGTGDIHFAVNGTREHIVYTGAAGIHDAAFLLSVNNMWYRFNGGLTFANNSLQLDSVTLRNIDADDPYGVAALAGHFNFEGFTIKNFDLTLNTDRLMVLSNESKKSLSNIYGPLTINTDGGNIHFHNTFEQPWLRGTINIMSAQLTMPQSGSSGPSVSSVGIYYHTLPNDSLERIRHMNMQRFGTRRDELDYAVNSGSVNMVPEDDSLFSNRMKDIYLEEDGTHRYGDTTREVTGPSKGALAPSFADRLRLALRINVQGDFTVSVPFSGAVGILGAHLQAEFARDRGISIDRGDDLVTHAVGELDLTQNSTFTFIQPFKITTGRIAFTDDFTNPEINIVADYEGPHNGASGGQAKIELAVTGTKEHPDVNAYIYTQNTGTGSFELRPYSKTEAFDEALYFLASGGSFKEDLSEVSEARILANLSTSVSTQIAANMLNRFTGSTGSQFALKSASLSGGGAQLAFAYRNVTFSYSNVWGDPSQAAFITDIPLNVWSNASFTRNMLLELQYHPNTTTSSAGALAQQPQFLSKLIWTAWRW